MSTLKVKLNGVAITPGIFSAVSQHETTQRNYDNFPTEVVYTGLDDWTQVESDLRELVTTIRDSATANQFTFEIS
jgi:hypothetical protein